MRIKPNKPAVEQQQQLFVDASSLTGDATATGAGAPVAGSVAEAWTAEKKDAAVQQQQQQQTSTTTTASGTSVAQSAVAGGGSGGGSSAVQVRPLRELLGCQDKSNRRRIAQRGDYWVLYNYVPARRWFRCDESITYTTHADFTFLDNLEPLLDRSVCTSLVF